MVLVLNPCYSVYLLAHSLAKQKLSDPSVQLLEKETKNSDQSSLRVTSATRLCGYV